MQRYIIRRALLNIPVILIVLIFVFGLLRLQPGDVLLASIEETGNYSKEQLDQFRKELGLADPIHIQFVKWTGGVLRGDFGNSLWTGQPTWTRFWSAVGVSIELTIIALLLGVMIGIPIGILSAIHQDTLLDYVGRLIAIIGIATPSFWVGTMAVAFPAIWWGYQAPLGQKSIFDDPLVNLQQYLVPGIILGFDGAAGQMRLCRSQMLEVLRQDYIRTARAKGLGERAVIYKHALKNAIIPLVTLWGGSIAGILGGSVIMEQLFSLPGVGQLTLTSFQLRDYTQIQTNILIITILLVFVILATDISYAFVDPRIRYR
jgi:peptide/nickel transport system permease protein